MNPCRSKLTDRTGQLASFGLLAGASSNLFTAPGGINGVTRFTGTTVESPCLMSAPHQDENKGSFHLSDCPMQACTAEVSTCPMKTGEVRHLQPNDTVIDERDFSACYELVGSGRHSGNYLIIVTYP